MTFLEVVKEKLIKQKQEELSNTESKIQEKQEKLEIKEKQLADLYSELIKLENQKEMLETTKNSISDEKIKLLSIIKQFLKNFSRIQMITKIIEGRQKEISIFNLQIRIVDARGSDIIEIIDLFSKLSAFFKELNKNINKNIENPYIEQDGNLDYKEFKQYFDEGENFLNTCSIVFPLIENALKIRDEVLKRKDIKAEQKKKLKEAIRKF